MAIQSIQKRVVFVPVSFSKQQLASAIALLVYVVGLAGLLFGDFTFFVRATPFVLVLNFALLFWTEQKRNLRFLLFLVLAFLLAMAVEIIGVNSGWVFGKYIYLDRLGAKLVNVPITIGLNWLMLVYCAGNAMDWILKGQSTGRSLLIAVFGGAIITTFFDWIMEPAAIRLGYWSWMGAGNVHAFNYCCWFLLSALLLFLYRKLVDRKVNYFAIALLAIQILFFLLLQWFLKK